MRPRAHAEIIKAWSDGQTIEAKNSNGKWVVMDWTQNWDAGNEYRIKPAAPKWPASSVDEAALRKTWADVQNGYHPHVQHTFDGLLASKYSDAALAYALESQQVVLMSEVQDLARELNKNLREKEKSEIAMAVAIAVRDKCRSLFHKQGADWIEKTTGHGWISNVDLPSIIASVRLP